MDKKLVLTGREIIEGALVNKDYKSRRALEAIPWQMVPLEDKTTEWKEWVADYFELVGLQQIQDKEIRILKNRRLAVGILDSDDYSLSTKTDYNYLNSHIQKEDINSPLDRFYPLIPSYINVFHGEILKRDISATVLCIDRETQEEKLQVKIDNVKNIILQDALIQKQQALAAQGIRPDQEIPPELQQQIQQEISLTEQLVEAEFKYKKYRHIIEDFGQLILNKDMDRFNMKELIIESFIERVCNSETVFHINMGEDDYKVEFLDNSRTFNHLSPNLKYYSDGDYFGFFEEVTVGDVISQNGKDLTKEQIKLLEDYLQNYLKEFSGHPGIFQPTMWDNEPGKWYNPYVPYKEQPMVNQSQWVHNEVVSSLFTDNTSIPISNLLSLNLHRNLMGQPKMFRKMTLYFKSQEKIGWLTKKDKGGVIIFQDWVNENFKITETPVYDQSLIKEKSQKTLIYGEHIDWKWTNEWRKIIKISPELSHSFWASRWTTSKFKPECIYIGGDKIPYQFNGDNPFEVSPPFEGVTHKMKGVKAISPVELLAPFQILLNIAWNKVPQIMFDDIGLSLALNELTISKANKPGIEAAGDPIEEAMVNLKENKVMTMKLDRDTLQQIGTAQVPLAPQVLNLSRIQEGVQYINVAQLIKEFAGETIGISRQRLAQAKASESATQTQAGINYSEVQTEYLFHSHLSEFMPRVYQKMIEAGMYYARKSEKMREFYQTSQLHNTVLTLEPGTNIFRQYSVRVKSDSNTRELRAKLEQLFVQNTRTDNSMYDLALGMTEDSPSQILENLRKSKVERDQLQERQNQQRLEELREQERISMEAQQREQEFELQKLQLELDSQEKQALIRSIGGIQTDNDKSGELDAIQNLQALIKQKQLDISSNYQTQTLDLKRQQHSDQMAYKDRELMAKQAIEQKRLAVAIANSNKSTDKEAVDKIARNNKIT